MAEIKTITIEKKKLAKKKVFLGWLLIILGFLALITPLTPGSWLIPIGLELIGVHLALWEKLVAFFSKKHK